MRKKGSDYSQRYKCGGKVKKYRHGGVVKSSTGGFRASPKPRKMKIRGSGAATRGNKWSA